MRILSLFAAIVIVSLAVNPAKAVTMKFEIAAKSLIPEELGNFLITYDDKDMDMLFSLNELRSFSGVLLFVEDGPNIILDILDVVPVIMDFADGVGTDWEFSFTAMFPNVTISPASNWTYTVTKIITPIPLPAPLLLLVTALAGLFGVSRFKRQAVVAA